MDKYIGFDINSKKTVAYVVQQGKTDRYCFKDRSSSLFVGKILLTSYIKGHNSHS